MPQNIATRIDAVVARSLDVIVSSQHSSGAFPAALNYPVYDYCWFRDGSFIADAISRYDKTDNATRFHLWCAAIINERRARITDLTRRGVTGEPVPGDEMLPTRYTLDGADGTEDWWDYQLDGYGTWLWALAQHLQRHQLPVEPYRPAIELLVGYLGVFGDHRCFDWWEEHQDQRHVSTLAAISAGLDAAASMTKGSLSEAASAASRRHADLALTSTAATGHLTKWIGTDAVDGSLLAASVPFDLIKPGAVIAEATYDKIIAGIVNNGVYRYRGDTFYGGGEWINLTAWLGWYEASTGRIDLAEKRREWITEQATPDGDLPEQVSTAMQAPEHLAEWQHKWGPVATPLLWSHAMFLTLDHAIKNAQSQP